MLAIVTPPPPPPFTPLTISAKLSASARATEPNQLVTFKVRAKFSDEVLFAKAALYIKIRGSWLKVKGSNTSLSDAGRAKWTYRVPGSRLQLRALVKADGVKAVSKPVTLT